MPMTWKANCFALVRADVVAPIAHTSVIKMSTGKVIDVWLLSLLIMSSASFAWLPPAGVIENVVLPKIYTYGNLPNTLAVI